MSGFRLRSIWSRRNCWQQKLTAVYMTIMAMPWKRRLMCRSFTRWKKILRLRMRMSRRSWKSTERLTSILRQKLRTKSSFTNITSKYEGGKLVYYIPAQGSTPAGDKGKAVVTNRLVVVDITVLKVDDKGRPLDSAVFTLQKKEGTYQNIKREEELAWEKETESVKRLGLSH